MDRLLDLTRQAEARHFWFRGFRAFVTPAIAAAVNGRRNLRVLDCGCGTGSNLDLLRPYGRGFGFDLSAGGLEIARRIERPLVRADATHIPFASERFDLVTCFDVLQCVPDDRGAIREMARVATRGGHVVLTLAAFDVLRGDHAEVWGEVRRYTPATARALAAEAGLVVERATFHFAATFPLMLAVRTAQRRLRRHRPLRDDTDIAVPSAPVNEALAALLAAEAAVSRVIPMPVGSSILLVARRP